MHGRPGGLSELLAIADGEGGRLDKEPDKLRRLTARRSLIRAAGAAVAARGVAFAAEPGTTRPVSQSHVLRKAILDSLLPASWKPADRFRLAVDLGFTGIEAYPPANEASVEDMQAAADRAGLRIHSVMNKDGNWGFPLSSEEPEIADKGLASLLRSIRVAARWKADCVLLVPAVVTPKVSYRQAWERSQRMIRRALPVARETGVSIAIENVGNRFLLSPLEFARYVDDFADPHLRAYFDVGNCLMLWGYPQDWLATLGRRIIKVHLKDCRTKDHTFVPLGEGDVDWAAVREGLQRIGFVGYFTIEPNYGSSELKRGDRQALADLSRRMDAVMKL
jgi:L-ribulose-5-phosphate 3-epimerase